MAKLVPFRAETYSIVWNRSNSKLRRVLFEIFSKKKKMKKTLSDVSISKLARTLIRIWSNCRNISNKNNQFRERNRYTDPHNVRADTFYFVWTRSSTNKLNDRETRKSLIFRISVRTCRWESRLGIFSKKREKSPERIDLLSSPNGNRALENRRKCKEIYENYAVGCAEILQQDTRFAGRVSELEPEPRLLNLRQIDRVP